MFTNMSKTIKISLAAGSTLIIAGVVWFATAPEPKESPAPVETPPVETPAPAPEAPVEPKGETKKRDLSKLREKLVQAGIEIEVIVKDPDMTDEEKAKAIEELANDFITF